MIIIIVNLSPHREKAELHTFLSDLGEISGIQTYEAPIRYLLTHLKQQDTRESISILPLATQEAMCSAKKLRELVNQEKDDLGVDAEVLNPITMKENEMEAAVCSITQLIHKSDTVYIDTTGGFRNTSYLMMAVVRILEYSGINLKRAIYANLNQNCIVDVTGLYRMFNLINAAEVFTSLGNSDGLMRFFEDSCHAEIKEALAAMNQFSEAIALCRTSDLSKILQQLNQSLLALEMIQPKNGSEILFKSFSGVIREKFGLQGTDQKEIDYADAICWCLENKLIQQAVTIYVEKLGEYLYKGEYFKATSETVIQFIDPKDHFDMYYRLFYSGLMELKGGLTAYFQEAAGNERIQKALCECNNIDTFKNRFRKDEQERIQKLKDGLKQFFRVKRCMYNDFGERLSDKEITENLKRNPGLESFAEINAKSVDRFVKTLCNNDPHLKKLVPTSDVAYSVPKFHTIENLEMLLAEQDAYSVCIPIEQMQTIMRDYLYLKSFRNSFNHAADDDFTEEQMSYFAQKGYPTDANLPLKDIIAVIMQALEHLKK